MSRTSTLPKRLQPMLATLTDAPFDDADWVFEDKYDGFRMIAQIRRGKVALYSRNGKIISHSYMEVARALERVNTDAVDRRRTCSHRKRRRLALSVAAERVAPRSQALVLRVRSHVLRRRGPSQAAPPRPQGTAERHSPTAQAARVQRPPEDERHEVLRRGRAKRP